MREAGLTTPRTSFKAFDAYPAEYITANSAPLGDSHAQRQNRPLQARVGLVLDPTRARPGPTRARARLDPPSGASRRELQRHSRNRLASTRLDDLDSAQRRVAS